MHTLPYWQDALRDLINFTDRCEIVACDMVMDAMYCDLEETDPYRFMADRLVRNTVNGNGTNRINATLELAKSSMQTALFGTAIGVASKRQGFQTLQNPPLSQTAFQRSFLTVTAVIGTMSTTVKP